MNSEERMEKFRLQRGELYAELGRFVVSFEELVSAMRQVISLHVGNVPAPFNLKQQQVANIFTSDLTADPLARVFRSMLLLTLEDYNKQEQRQDIEKLLSNLCSRIDKINRARNIFLHGTWFINYASEEQEDFSRARGIKSTNTAKGLRIDHLDHTVESFSEYIDECVTLRELVFGIGIPLIIEDIDILENFAIKDGKLVKLHA